MMIAFPAAHMSFNPTHISGLQHWLDGSNETSITIGTGISQWNDLSGNGRNCTQSTGSQQPTVASAHKNGLDTVRFEASSSQFMDFSSAIDASGDVTYFVVCKLETADRSIEVYRQSAATSNFPFEIYTTSGDTFMYAKSDSYYLACHTTPITTDPTADYIYVTWRFANSGLGSSSFRVNGSAGALESFGGGTGATISINRIGHHSTTYYSDGWVAEQGVYNKLLSTEEISVLEGYLKRKWGL